VTAVTEPVHSKANGQFIRGDEAVARDAEAAKLRGQGLTYRAIAQTLGYASKSSAHDAVGRAFRDTLTEPAEQARAVELARLEDAHDAALAVLLREHVTVSHGKVITVKDDQGNDVPLIDDGPTLQAIDRIERLSVSRRKLLGLDAPLRHELTMGDIDAALAATNAALAAARSEAGQAPGATGQAG
jgi:hypothetical protein